MITEALVVKGLMAIGHFAATHMTAGVAAHLAHVAAGMTISQLIGTTVTAGFVAGCITWTQDRINNVKNGIAAIDNGNYWTAVKEFGSLAISADVSADMLPDKVDAVLEKLNLNREETKKVTRWVRNHEDDIAKYIRDHK